MVPTLMHTHDIISHILFENTFLIFWAIAAQLNYSKPCQWASFRLSQFIHFIFWDCFSFLGLQHWWRRCPPGSPDLVFGWKLTTLTILWPTIYSMADVSQLLRGFHAARKHNLIQKDSHILSLAFNAKDVFSVGSSSIASFATLWSSSQDRGNINAFCCIWMIWDHKQLNSEGIEETESHPDPNHPLLQLKVHHHLDHHSMKGYLHSRSLQSVSITPPKLHQ